MKRKALILVFTSLTLLCRTELVFSQSEYVRSHINNLRLENTRAYEERAKADRILSLLDSIPGEKILFSMYTYYRPVPHHYYVICKEKDFFREYHISVDVSGEIKFRELDSVENMLKWAKKRWKWEWYREYKSLIEKRNQAFDTKRYRTNFVTITPPNSNPSFSLWEYFVLKDADGNRYGEYHIWGSLPPPIPIETYVFVISRLFSTSYK